MTTSNFVVEKLYLVRLYLYDKKKIQNSILALVIILNIIIINENNKN